MDLVVVLCKDGRHLNSLRNSPAHHYIFLLISFFRYVFPSLWSFSLRTCHGRYHFPILDHTPASRVLYGLSSCMLHLHTRRPQENSGLVLIFTFEVFVTIRSGSKDVDRMESKW